MQINAWVESDNDRWKRTSLIAYNIGKFGNSDPKKYPTTIKKYMPELWADLEENDINNDPLIKAARARQLQKK